MKKINFGNERTKVIKKSLGEYYAKFDRDVIVYELSISDEEKITNMYQEIYFGYKEYNPQQIKNIFKEIENNKAYFIENIRNEKVFKYVYTAGKKIEIA